jgi:nucleotide-binding universal stress UspA family protein
MFRKIAVAYDESAEAERAFRTAIQLAKALTAELLTITVVDELPAYTAYAAGADTTIIRTLNLDRAQFYEELRTRAMASASSEGITVTAELINGDAVEAVATFVRTHKIDLLVVGLHHRSSRVSRLWSTVYSLAQDVPCSVLGVH